MEAQDSAKGFDDRESADADSLPISLKRCSPPKIGKLEREIGE